jgi:hypothetical protein
LAQRGDTHNGGTDEKYPSGRRAHLTSDVRRTASRRSMLCRTLSLPVLTSAGPRPPCLHSWGTFRACPPELRPLTAKFHSRLTTNLRRQILTTNLQTPYLTCGESDGHRTHSGWLQGMHLALFHRTFGDKFDWVFSENPCARTGAIDSQETGWSGCQ